MALQTALIPFTNVPQEFEITLADRELILVNKWNEPSQCWLIDIIDAVTGNPIVAGIPMVTGCDLLEQYAYLGLNGQIIIYTDGDELSPPTLTNLGVEGNAYFRNEVEE